MIDVVVLSAEDVGDRSYLVHDGRHGAVIDAQHDAERVRKAAAEAGVTITHVLETHVHNDYVSGGFELATACHAAYVVAADEPVAFWRERVGVRDGDRLRSGELEMEVVHTPGHTPHHLSYVVRAPGEPERLFTGGSLLFGTVGRSDLFGPDAAPSLARAQWRSLQRMAGQLPGATEIFPTHGFGSFCAAGSTGALSRATMADQLAHNRAFSLDEDAFVAEATEAVASFPRYYGFMAPANRRGLLRPSEIRPVEPAAAAEAAACGGLVVDVRPGPAFAASHLPGSFNVAWSASFPAYLGWTVPWGLPLTLVGDDEDLLRRAADSLSYIGLNELSVCLLETPSPSRSYPVCDFPALAREWGRLEGIVLDVRERSEWEAGHLQGARNVPFHAVEAAVALIGEDETTYVHCALGQRAAIAASLLDRLGRRPVLVHDAFERAAGLGLPVVA